MITISPSPQCVAAFGQQLSHCMVSPVSAVHSEEEDLNEMFAVRDDEYEPLDRGNDVKLLTDFVEVKANLLGHNIAQELVESTLKVSLMV